jgi:hypothetical protein
LGGRGRRISALEASLVYKVSARTARATQRNPVSKNKKTKTKKKKKQTKNLTNRNQDHSPSSEPRTPTSPSPGHTNTPEKLDPDLRAYLTMMVEDIKDFNNSLKEI